MFDVRRREFITLLGGAASWPLAARAQQAERMRLIGVLMAYAESDPEGQAWVAAFREALQKLGWAEGRNIRIDTRWATPDVEAMQRFAKELVALQPDLILSQSTPTTAALVQQTRTIPIIFANIADPVGSGFVANFPRPGGNVTGFVLFEPTMAGKWLELLKEIAPRVNRVAFLFNPATATYFEYYMNSFKVAAASFGVEAIAAPVHDRSELESVFAPQAREPNSSLIVMPDSFLNAHRVEITSLAARYRLPAVYPYRLYTKVGGLLSYGNDVFDNYRRAAGYVDRILKGEKPSELPVANSRRSQVAGTVCGAWRLAAPWLARRLRETHRRRNREVGQGCGVLGCQAGLIRERWPRYSVTFVPRMALPGGIDEVIE